MFLFFNYGQSNGIILHRIHVNIFLNSHPERDFLLRNPDFQIFIFSSLSLYLGFGFITAEYLSQKIKLKAPQAHIQVSHNIIRTNKTHFPDKFQRPTLKSGKADWMLAWGQTSVWQNKVIIVVRRKIFLGSDSLRCQQEPLRVVEKKVMLWQVGHFSKIFILIMSGSASTEVRVQSAEDPWIWVLCSNSMHC